MNLKFQDGDNTISKTYGNIKESATDEDIYSVATVIASLSDKPAESIKKIVESDLANI